MLTSAVSSPSLLGNGLAESHRHKARWCHPTDVKETRPSEITTHVQGHTATQGLLWGCDKSPQRQLRTRHLFGRFWKS